MAVATGGSSPHRRFMGALAALHCRVLDSRIVRTGTRSLATSLTPFTLHTAVAIHARPP